MVVKLRKVLEMKEFSVIAKKQTLEFHQGNRRQEDCQGRNQGIILGLLVNAVLTGS